MTANCRVRVVLNPVKKQNNIHAVSRVAAYLLLGFANEEARPLRGCVPDVYTQLPAITQVSHKSFS